MVKKIPPPPPLATGDQSFNRWLIELTSILNAQGGIDPGSVTGLEDVIAQVNTNTGDITTSQGQISTLLGYIVTLNDAIGVLAGQIGGLQTSIDTLNTQVGSLNSQVAALNARPQLFNGSGVPSSGLGNNNDWYAATGATKHVYVKLAGAWVQIV